MKRLARSAPLVALLALGTALGGCSTNLRQFTGSIGALSGPAPQGGTGNMGALAARYDARPGDKRASLDYAAALRANGQIPQAVAVLQRASVNNIGDREVAAAYGKVLADAGRFEEALGVLAQAQTEDRPDWQVLSAMGSVNDQLGKHSRARDLYQSALKIAPNQPALLNNLGLSYMLTRELDKAEATLAQAAALPGADPRVAANLALARSLRAQAAKGQGTSGQGTPGSESAAPALRTGGGKAKNEGKSEGKARQG